MAVPILRRVADWRARLALQAARKRGGNTRRRAGLRSDGVPLPTKRVSPQSARVVRSALRVATSAAVRTSPPREVFTDDSVAEQDIVTLQSGRWRMSTIEAVPRDLPGCKSSGAAIAPLEDSGATESPGGRSDEHKRHLARARTGSGRHGASTRKSPARGASAPSKHTRTLTSRDSGRTTVAQNVDDILAVHALDVRDTEPQAAPSFPDTLPSQRYVWLTKLRGWLHARR